MSDIFYGAFHVVVDYSATTRQEAKTQGITILTLSDRELRDYFDTWGRVC